MNRIDTSDPIPREAPLACRQFRFDCGEARYLDVPEQMDEQVFWEVVSRRKSRREFGQLNELNLAALLWYTEKTISQKRLSNGIVWEHRPTPSAGGLHPISIVVQAPEDGTFPLFHYDPFGHALRQIAATKEACCRLSQLANEVLDAQSGTVLWLVADFRKADAFYSNADSLVWRDCGALIGMLCLVAEALNLNACPLGICGDEWLRIALSLPDGIHGVGAVIVGGRVIDDDRREVGC